MCTFVSIKILFCLHTKDKEEIKRFSRCIFIMYEKQESILHTKKYNNIENEEQTVSFRLCQHCQYLYKSILFAIWYFEYLYFVRKIFVLCHLMPMFEAGTMWESFQ